MKRINYSAIVCCIILLYPITSACPQKIAIYSFPVEIELTNDQGDMLTKDYLKNYGTKGKKRGNEIMYESVTPFLMAQLKKGGLDMLSVDTLSFIKSNEYRKPSATLSKAISSGIADEYMKVYLKDITSFDVASNTLQDPNAQRNKLVKIRCRIQIYDHAKKLIKESVGEFQSGGKIENPSELGVDFRQYQGSDYLQEVKIYETCCKMSIMNAVAQLRK